MKDMDGIFNCYNDYLNSEVQYQEDGLYIGDIRIMTYDQVQVMDRYAECLAKNRLNIKVLEVGYGLGVFADSIEKYSIQKHVIIDCHPQICNIARKKYIHNKNVEVCQDFWQNYRSSIQFDSIFYDTTVLNGDAVNSLVSFLNWSQQYMSNSGIVSFWYCGDKIDFRILDYLEQHRIKYEISLFETQNRKYMIFKIYKGIAH